MKKDNVNWIKRTTKNVVQRLVLEIVQKKIRTYNYPQNRVTDHRIGYTVNQLDRIMDGRLDDLMAALRLADQQAKIAGEKE